tara:strand:- start:6050 stop:6274 length:225 start_codon:yes stop_codon:yes gene_type:complete
MELKEIVERDINAPIDQDEALFVLKEYVRVRKGRDINPTIITNMPAIFIIQQLELMSKMTLHAIVWFRDNPNKI